MPISVSTIATAVETASATWTKCRSASVYGMLWMPDDLGILCVPRCGSVIASSPLTPTAEKTT